MLKNKIFTFLLLAIFPLSLFSSSKPIKDEKIKIVEIKKTLSFFKNKKGVVKAKLTVSQLAESISALPIDFQRVIFFDETSEVISVKTKVGRKTIKIPTIISDYESNGIFHSDLKTCIFGKKLVTKGEQIGYRYEKVFHDLKFLNSLYFNDIYPIDVSELIVKVPDWMELDLRQINFGENNPTIENYTEENETVTKFSMKDLPSFIAFSNTPSRSKIDPHIIPIVSSFTIKGKKENFLTDVSDLYKWYSTLVDGIGNEANNLQPLVEELTQGKTDDLEKIKSIYYWVQDNIRYIAFENGIMGFQPENCQSVFSNKYGDCKGMANLTKEMLKIAGYDARLTWLGTRDIPYTYEIPSLMVDNHMICTVILNDEKIFLDPTEKYSDLFNYALRIQGQEALIEDGDKFIIEKIPELTTDESQELTTNELSLEGDQLIGSGTTKFTGNRKSLMYYYLAARPSNKRKEYIINYIGNRDKNVKIEFEETPSIDDRGKDIQIDYSLSVENKIINLGKELYLNLEIDFPFQNFDMDKERDVAYEFRDRYSMAYNTTFTIPENMSMKYLPTAINIDTDGFSFDLSYKVDNNKIIYNRKIVIKNEILSPNQFEDWNASIEQLKEFYGDQIILNLK